MKMKRVLLAEEHGFLQPRLMAVVDPNLFVFTVTRTGFAEIESSTGEVLASTFNPGGKNAPPHHYGQLVVELPAYLVRKGVPTYRGPVK